MLHTRGDLSNLSVGLFFWKFFGEGTLFNKLRSGPDLTFYGQNNFLSIALFNRVYQKKLFFQYQVVIVRKSCVTRQWINYANFCEKILMSSVAVRGRNFDKKKQFFYFSRVF